ncbi:thioesterase family protein, partial [Pseudomonas aeruginosa]|uniref:thioesterase family protein n=1 Tax=Pseudomonas aeruginosa TaxID=287 RepID=UPI0035ABF780
PMPFTRPLGLKLDRYKKAFPQFSFNNQPMMVGNWAKSILHGGVIASALDVAAGLVCVGSTLTRHDTINEEELRQRLSRMGTIDLRVDYLRPGRGERFTATSTLLRAGNKVAVSPAGMHKKTQGYISSGTGPPIGGGLGQKEEKHSLLQRVFSMGGKKTRVGGIFAPPAH